MGTYKSCRKHVFEEVARRYLSFMKMIIVNIITKVMIVMFVYINVFITEMLQLVKRFQRIGL